MNISVNWLKKFTDIDLSIDDLTTRIGSHLVEIESVTPIGDKYKDVLVARVTFCEPLENSDHLNLTKIDDGGVRGGVERDEQGFIQVVCGAPNVAAGQLIAWLPPESIVPETYDDPEPFVLGARKLRGAMSNGMIASARELALYDEHDGILVLDEDVAPGTPFRDVFELDDYILDIENKSLTHRPDAFGVIGFAREVAAIEGKAFQSPDWYTNVDPQFEPVDPLIDAPQIVIDDPSLCARYQAVVLSGADGAKKSPVHVQTYLARVGVRPISAVVDVTNYLMLVSGQPLHAFDYDKVMAISGGDPTIHVRGGRDKETLTLLDGRTIELSPEDIVIAAGETAIGLAGAMGGASTEIDESTTHIILESATFDLYHLRATQMRHGIFSEAITRFTKGQPAALTAPVLAEAVRLLGEYSGASLHSTVAEVRVPAVAQETLVIDSMFVNSVLGTKLSNEDIVDTLQNVEFTVAHGEDQSLAVQPPFWRADIHIPEDVVEEVGRITGFDTIELRLPRRTFTAVRPSDFDQLKSLVRHTLVRAGAHEVLLYSFVHGKVLLDAQQRLDQSYRITNSLSPDLQYYRQTLTPSLLTTLHPNVKQGYEGFAVFELNTVHHKERGLTDEGVPVESRHVALSLTRPQADSGSIFYDAKKYVSYLASTLQLEVRFSPLELVPTDPLASVFEPKRSARVSDRRTGEVLGIVGEYKKAVGKAFKLPAESAGFELDLEKLFAATRDASPSYQPLSKYPRVERDICFKVAKDQTYGGLVDVLEGALDTAQMPYEIAPVDIYQAPASETKNITIRLQLMPADKTLTGEQVRELLEHISGAANEQLHAVVI